MKLWKKFAIGIGATMLLGFAAWVHGATLNSSQVGSNPQNGYYLQTNGATSTWVTAPTGTATTTINGIVGPTFTLTIKPTSTGANAWTITTSSANLFLNLLQYTSGTNINVSSNGVINFVNPGFPTAASSVVWTGTQTFAATTTLQSSTLLTFLSNPCNILNTNASGSVGCNSTNYLTSAPATTTINGTQTSTFYIVGTAGNISSTVSGATTTLDLANVTSSGSCTNCSISVDTKGRVTTYANGSSASAAGSQTNVQYNDGGTFAATSTFTYTSSTHVFVTAGTSTPTVTAAGTNFTSTSTTAGVRSGDGQVSITPNGSSTQNFSFVNHSVSYTVPVGISSLVINVMGASGGQTGFGLGGSTTGTLSVTPGTIYWFSVGQSGSSTGNGGYGGGGTGQGGAGGGGGMSWFSSTSTFSSSTVLLVGGGGGGGTGSASTGGNGGGLVGGDGITSGGNHGGSGGTQSGGGAGGVGITGNGTDGTFGQGGNGANPGAGGGGGYGGGGGGGGQTSVFAGGGGGGSGFISSAISIIGNNNNGMVTLGGNSKSSIQVNFTGNPFASANGTSCVIAPNNATNTWYITNATTSFTVNFDKMLNPENTFNYHCEGY